MSRAALMLLLSLAAGLPAAAAPPTLDLAIGDPARRDRQAPLVLDAVTDSRTGETLNPDELAARLDAVRLVVVGEEHTDAEFHRVQLTLLEALARHGRPLLVGLEMFPAREQAVLDAWNAGLYTEDGFVRLGRWYEHWGYPWGYYREIFRFAQQHGIPLYALNAPREVVSAVHKKGLAGLSPEEAAHLPAKIEPGGADARTLFRSYFTAGDPLHGAMSDAELDGMMASQATWDAAMAKNALAALDRHGRPESLMVILAGSGHAAYGMGIERQAASQGFAGKTAAVIPVAVEDEEGKPVTHARASYADFLWGVARERFPAFPEVGLSTTAASDGGKPALKVVFVQEKSPAARAGLTPGDLVLALDGQALPDRETWSRALAAKRWGDRAVLTVKRGDKIQEIRIDLRRRVGE